MKKRLNIFLILMGLVGIQNFKAMEQICYTCKPLSDAEGDSFQNSLSNLTNNDNVKVKNKCIFLENQGINKSDTKIFPIMHLSFLQNYETYSYILNKYFDSNEKNKEIKVAQLNFNGGFYYENSDSDHVPFIIKNSLNKKAKIIDAQYLLNIEKSNSFLEISNGFFMRTSTYTDDLGMDSSYYNIGVSGITKKYDNLLILSLADKKQIEFFLKVILTLLENKNVFTVNIAPLIKKNLKLSILYNDIDLWLMKLNLKKFDPKKLYAQFYICNNSERPVDIGLFKKENVIEKVEAPQNRNRK